jgi:hypothetical protein
VTWFKVDDKLTSSRKVLRIPRAHRVAAMGLWALAGSWCSSALTDGAVPAYMAEELGGTEELALHLVAVGMWHHAADEACPAEDERCTANRPKALEDGWWFHDWKQCNPLRTEVETEREQAKERMRQLREKRSPEVRPNKKRTPPNVTGTAPEVRNTRPVPSRPEVPAEPASGGRTAQVLVAEWIDHCPERPPSRVIGQVAKELAGCLNDGIPYEAVRAGLQQWQLRGLHPSNIASVVHELRTVGASPIRPRNGGPDLDAAMARAQAREAG